MTVLAALSDLPSDDQYIQSEFSAIKDTVLEMSKGSFADLFTMTEDRHFHRTVDLSSRVCNCETTLTACRYLPTSIRSFSKLVE